MIRCQRCSRTPTVSQVGHVHDVPLEAMLPLLSKAQVGALSIALANLRHQHAYKVFKPYPLPSYFHPKSEHG